MRKVNRWSSLSKFQSPESQTKYAVTHQLWEGTQIWANCDPNPTGLNTLYLTEMIFLLSSTFKTRQVVWIAERNQVESKQAEDRVVHK